MNSQALEERANEWVEAQGFTKGTMRAAARKAFVHAFNLGFDLGGRDGWMRCGIYHIDFNFERRPEEIKEVEKRYPAAPNPLSQRQTS